ncbi:MAG: hypothetical protein ABIJ34_05540 [archaeon]
MLKKISLIATIAMVTWTIFLFTSDGRDWFVYDWIFNMWKGFDVVLSIFLAFLTYGLFEKRKYVKFLAPVIFGMVITDWIFNIQLWIYAGYNLLEPRFIFSFIGAAIVIYFFYWFTKKCVKDTSKI